MNLPLNDKKIKNNNLLVRYNHILFTFVLGILLSDFLNLKTRIENDYKKYFKTKENIFLKVWLILSLYHDYGYFIQEEYKKFKKLDDVPVNNRIFDFEEQNRVYEWFGLKPEKTKKLRYNEDIIEKYYECYANSNMNSNEPIEHGILGGYVLYDAILNNNANNQDKLKKFFKQNLDEFSNDVLDNNIYVDICYRIIEHNIWAIDTSNKFFSNFNNNKVLEPIYKNKFPKIGTDESLLMLLSLTDTIEYIKRLSITGIDNPNSQNRPSTLAKKIYINVSNDEINIDTFNVKKINGYDKWFNDIKNMSDWIIVETIITENNIKIKKISQ